MWEGIDVSDEVKMRHELEAAGLRITDTQQEQKTNVATIALPKKRPQKRPNRRINITNTHVEGIHSEMKSKK